LPTTLTLAIRISISPSASVAKAATMNLATTIAVDVGGWRWCLCWVMAFAASASAMHTPDCQRRNANFHLSIQLTNFCKTTAKAALVIGRFQIATTTKDVSVAESSLCEKREGS
jgi:hypothetical protein